MPDLTPVEATAMAVWSTGSADSTQCLMAVRAAIRAERAQVAEEIAQALESRAQKIRDIADVPVNRHCSGVDCGRGRRHRPPAHHHLTREADHDRHATRREGRRGGNEPARHLPRLPAPRRTPASRSCCRGSRRPIH